MGGRSSILIWDGCSNCFFISVAVSATAILTIGGIDLVLSRLLLYLLAGLNFVTLIHYIAVVTIRWKLFTL